MYGKVELTKREPTRIDGIRILYDDNDEINTQTWGSSLEG